MIQRHVRTLNSGFGWPISLAVLQFSVEICIYSYNLIARMWKAGMPHPLLSRLIQRIADRLKTSAQAGTVFDRSSVSRCAA